MSKITHEDNHRLITECINGLCKHPIVNEDLRNKMLTKLNNTPIGKDKIIRNNTNQSG